MKEELYNFFKKNSWVTDNGKNPLENYSNRDLTPNEEDINRALTKISFMAVVLVTAKVRRKANIARMNVERKKSQGRIFLFCSKFHRTKSLIDIKGKVINE